MPASSFARYLKNIEFFAYLLSAWSFLVLFMEPIISYYLDYRAMVLGTALANILLLSLTVLHRMLLGESKRKRITFHLDIILLALGIGLLTYQTKFVIFALLIRQTYFILEFFLFRAFEGKLYQMLASNPPVSLMSSFGAVIGFGTVMLMLPSASTSGYVTNFIDALFTATSATCVTGLTVLDTGTHFTLFGQIVILMLIQVGGLGIMTISTAFAIILGQRITLKLESVMHSVVGEPQQVNVLNLLRSIVLVTALIEFIGAVMLFTKFSTYMATGKAMYYAIFHSISAFCNAGFSLWSDNLSMYIDSPIVNFSITGLIILGGLGFSVLIDLYHYLSTPRKTRRLTLHSKAVLLTTLILAVGGCILLYLAEYYGVMDDFPIWRRIMASWFQSISARTAGFNTLNINGIGSAAVLITLVLMFVGASPGSTGGGIKTTTFTVLIMSVISMLRGRKDLVLFNRKIPASNIREATSLVTLSAGLIFVTVFILMLIEPFKFEQILFEAISAFGTVGLSMGITSSLTPLGKLLITLLMYIGRIGPLTLIFAVSISKKQANVSFAEEKMAIG